MVVQSAGCALLGGLSGSQNEEHFVETEAGRDFTGAGASGVGDASANAATRNLCFGEKVPESTVL